MDLVTFTEKILDEKPHFLHYSVSLVVFVFGYCYLIQKRFSLML